MTNGMADGSGRRDGADVAIVCCGGGAAAIGEILCRRSVCADVVAVNTDSESLRSAVADRTVALSVESFSGDALRARDAAASSTELSSELEHRSGVVIVACLGGGAGSGCAPVVARRCAEAGIRVRVVAVMPFDFEGRTSVAEKALRWIEDAVGSDAVTVLSNQELASRADASLPFGEMIGAINASVAETGIAMVSGMLPEDRPPRFIKRPAVSPRAPSAACAIPI